MLTPLFLLFAGFGVIVVVLLVLVIALGVVGRRRGPEQSTFHQVPHSLAAPPYPPDMNQGIHAPPMPEGHHHHHHHHEPGFAPPPPTHHAPPPMHHAPPPIHHSPPPSPPPMHHHH